MELLIAIVVIGVLGLLVVRSMNKDKKETSHSFDAETKKDEAPYKVETPVPAYDVAPQPVTVVEGIPSHLVVEGAGVVELPKAEEKKTRKPRAPKTEKPAAKKAAPKKAAATKATKKSKKV